MKIAVVGGDRRFDELIAILRERHDVLRDPLPEMWAGLDMIVMQAPAAADMERVHTHLRPDARLVYLGGSAAVPPGVDGFDLLSDADFVRRNAVLTAEGAVCAAMQATGGALTGSRCLVVGWGRIARALAGMLRGLGADVTVAARRPEARLEARAAGWEACATSEPGLAAAAALADYVFSTPPAQVVTERVLQAVKPGVPVFDLASAPYGVDLTAAQRLGVHARRESGVPGRYCPRAAAQLMADVIERLAAGPACD